MMGKKIVAGILSVVAVFLLIILCIIDIKTSIYEGYVTSKHYEEPRTTYIWAGRCVVPHYIPEHYVVSIELDGKYNSCSVSKDFYMKVEIGDYVNLKSETKVVLEND
jgi:hypothetical protein